MAMTGVLRPGHASIRVLDLEKDAAFYRDVLGMIETGRDRQGRAYFKAWDERDHNSLVLRQAQQAGLDHFAFKVLDRKTLDRLDSDLRASGVPTERIPAGEMLETGERVRFQIPSGHVIELFAEKGYVGSRVGDVNPAPWVADLKGIAPVRMDHAQLNGGDIDGVRKLFTEVLGFSLVERMLMEDGKTDMGIWLTCSAKAHDIAFVRHPEDGKLHHVSYMLDTWEQVLRAADIMSMKKVKVDIGPTRHGITRGTTIYAFDASGNRFETFCGGYQWYPDMKAAVWTWNDVGSAIFYHDRRLNESFLNVVT